MYFKDDFFRSASYQQLHAVATVLERFVARAPKAISVTQLFNDIDLTAYKISNICSSLSKIGLIIPVEETDKWMLVIHPAQITLEDVWRSAMLDEKMEHQILLEDGGREQPDDIDLLITQAFLAINQSISIHLRKFQLDRVKVSQRSL